MLKNFECIPVKAVQAVAAAKPHKALFILYYWCNGVAGQSIDNLIIFKIISWWLRKADFREEKEGDKNTDTFHAWY